MMRYILILIPLLFIWSCADDVVVKPKAQLRLEYQVPQYEEVDFNCNYTFQKNKAARLQSKKNCWVNLHYPRMKATVYVSYQAIQDSNLNALLYDAQKLTYDHTVKADAIYEQPRVDTINNVYGMFYTIDGDAATQSQFYVTDSINHFVTGSLYFESKPNFDSLYPAIMYLRNDIRTLMETIDWK